MKSPYFLRAILFVIILNSIVIGLYTMPFMEQNYTSVITILDYIFLSIFLVEIMLKWGHGFVLFWQDNWNVFDFVLVAMSLIGEFVNKGLNLYSGTLVNIFRIMRAFRSLRILGALRQLQVVVNTFLKSLLDLANIVLITMILMFIFAVVGVQLFAETNPQSFGTLTDNMYSLWIYITQDGWVDILREFEEQAAPDYPFAPAIYAMAFIVLGSWIFMNIISGVAVTNWQLYVQAMRRERKQKFHAIRGYMEEKVIF